MSEPKAASGHEKIETNNFLMIVLILLVVAVGGLLYLSGMLVMAWNVVMTVRSGRAAPSPIPRLVMA